MKHIYFKRMFVCVMILHATVLRSFSQSNLEVWKEINPQQVTIGERSDIPKIYKAFRLDFSAMVSLLNTALYDTIPGAYQNGPLISIPMPDGSLSRFRAAYTPVMQPELAAQFPMIRTFTAIGIDDTLAIARLDYTQWGFHAFIISPNGWVIVDPASLGNTSDYITFNRSNSVQTNPFVCETSGMAKQVTPHIDNNVYRSSGTSLRTYRLALACTGEYAAFYGGTVAGAASGMATSVSRVTQVYEVELAIRLTLIGNNNSLIYTNASTDPYTNSNGSTMLTQNQTTINNTIGSANYDIGHVFSTGGGGVAYLGCVCGSNKAGGVTGSSAPVGDAYDIDYVAHEMGHQFGGDHTFNSTTGSCGGGNRSSTAAYEPGSGTTIMAYAGICGADDIQPHSDAIFHTKSFDQIEIYTTTGNGASCDVSTPTNNTPPVVTLPANKTIPKLTSFILTGSATDANGDPLTYLWEQYDLGPSGAPNSPSGNAPLFRDFTPTTSPSRTFPRIEDIVRNTQTKGEILPSYARSMTFRFTARDNKLSGGGVMHDDNVVTVTVVDPSDTFKVTTPNTNITWVGGSANTVTWKVASTNIAPVSCANVNILLSIDSGYTFPYTLAANTPNDGSESITLPVVTSTKARIKVESVGNIFFDMSNVNFTISAPSGTLTTITTSAIATSNLCAGAAVSVPFTVNANANAGNVFTAQLSNAAGSFASPVSIGTLTSTAAGTISAVIPAITVTGTGYRIRVVSSNPVVTGSDNGTNLSIFQTPVAAGSITGTATVCAGQAGVVYSVPAITNATEYVWTVPANVTITSGSTTNSITVTFLSNAASGSITVAGKNNGCGNGTVSSPFNVTVNPVPSSAGVITGVASVCPGQNSVAYSVPSISGATGYAWVLPTGASIATGANTNSITVNFSQSAVSGNITVSGTNTCGSGASSSFGVTVMSLPASFNITAGGPVNFCSGGSVLLSRPQSANNVYQWRKDGIAIAGQTGTTYSATASGIYDVIADTIKTFTNSNRISIPDNSCTGALRSVSVSGYTGTVPSAGITVKVNITQTYDGDLAFFLQAPNGTILGLSNLLGSSGDNFTNTVFSDAGATVLPSTATGAPFTGTYKPSGVFTACVTSTLATFGAIGGGAINPNGNWTLMVYDRVANDTGSVLNWTLSLPPSLNGPCVRSSNQITVTTTASSVASVSIASGSGSSICQGANVTFTATPVNGGTTPAYQWKINGVNAGSNSSILNTSLLNNNDIVTCVMTSNGTCITNNPATSNPLQMTVNPVVNASVSIAANTGTTICSGTNVTFTATPVNGGTTPSYQWKLNNVNVGSNLATYSNSTLANGNFVTCVMTSNATCVSGNPATSNILVITVNSPVNASVNITASPSSTICSGTNVTFNAAPLNGGAAPSYQWKVDGVNAGTNNSSFSSSSLANGNIVSCVLTSNATCVTNSPVASNNITMTVNPVLNASVSISANPSSTICSGTNVIFTATPVNGGTPSYQWKIDGVNTGSNSATYSSNSLSNGNLITCEMTSNAACVTNNPAVSNIITMSVTQALTASISISANPGTNVCAGTNVSFTAALLNGGGLPSYQWKIGNTNVGTNSSTYSNSALANGDVITCVFSSHDACITNNPATSNVLTMTVNPNVTPQVSISASPGNAICPGTQVTFTAAGTNTGGSPVYQWKNNGLNVGTNSNSFSSSSLADGDQIVCEMTSNANCTTVNPASSNIITMNVNPSVTINSFSPPGGNAGTLVTINGSGFLTATVVAFNNLNTTFSIVDNNTITAMVPTGVTTGPISITGCGQSSSVADFIHVEQVTLQMKIAVEGLQTGGGQMRGVLSPVLSDSIQVSLASATTPFEILSSVKNVLNLSGQGDFIFPASVFGKSFYLVVDHRNCLQTWSASPVLFSDSLMQYDFTDAASKAYGNNLVNISGIFAIRSGDINKDGIVDLNDISNIAQSGVQFNIGYIPQDVNGDNMVESADYSLVENNFMISIAHP